MKYKIKTEENKYIVMDKNDNIISKWSKETIDDDIVTGKQEGLS